MITVQVTCIHMVASVESDLKWNEKNKNFIVKSNVHEPVHKYFCNNYQSNNTKGHIAVLFFGLARSTDIIYPTLKKYLFDILKQQGITFDIFWVTTVSKYVNNHASNEKNITVDYSKDIDIIRPCRYIQYNNDLIRANEFEKFCSKRGICDIDTIMGTGSGRGDHNSFFPFDWYRNHYSTVKNFLATFYTQEKGAELIKAYSEKYQIEYDGVLVTRADNAFIKPIDIVEPLEVVMDEIGEIDALAFLINIAMLCIFIIIGDINKRPLKGSKIFIPSFNNYHMKANDRMAFGSNPVILNSYLLRGTYFRDNPRSAIVQKSTSMESYLYHYLVNLESFDVQYTNNRLLRVRADGE